MVARNRLISWGRCGKEGQEVYLICSKNCRIWRIGGGHRSGFKVKSLIEAEGGVLPGDDKSVLASTGKIQAHCQGPPPRTDSMPGGPGL